MSLREGTPQEERRRGVEEHPWKTTAYVIYIVQLMGITLDLFMDTSVVLGWHYTITTIELLFALYLSIYQAIRLVALDPRTSKATFLLIMSLLMQLAIAGMAAYSYTENSDAVEWTFFGIAIAWGIVNPMTYSAVAAAGEAENKSRIGPGAAIWSVFTQHFRKAPFLSAFGTLFAMAHAILDTYQGAVINDLTKAVTKGRATEKDIEKLGFTLVLVWLSASIAKLIFDIISSKMFSKLEIWLRRTVFDDALQSKQGMSIADYQARYASDVNGVVSLYGTLLKGVLINVLLICTNFAFLAINEWRVATVTLAFLAMGATSGPTDLAGDSAADVQEDVTRGLALLQESADDGEADQNYQERHQKEILDPIEKHLFRKSFFSGAVDTFNNFFSSFLTAVVVITMSWNVFYGDMDSSQFLGIFFVFKGLQKSATKLSGIIKKAVAKTANLKRINDVVFKSQKENGDETNETTGNREEGAETNETAGKREEGAETNETTGNS